MIKFYCFYKKEKVSIKQCEICFQNLKHDKKFRKWENCKNKYLKEVAENVL